MKLWPLFAFILLTTDSTHTENFIIKKNNPKLSVQKLKEHAGNSCADFLHYSAPTIKKIAHVQEFCVKGLDDLVNSNKSGLLCTASKETLQECSEKINNLNQALIALQEQLDDACQFINKQRVTSATEPVKKNK